MTPCVSKVSGWVSAREEGGKGRASGEERKEKKKARRLKRAGERAGWSDVGWSNVRWSNMRCDHDELVTDSVFGI